MFIPPIAAKIFSKSVNGMGRVAITGVVVVAADAAVPKSVGAKKPAGIIADTADAVAKPSRKTTVIVDGLSVPRGGVLLRLWTLPGDGGVSRDGEFWDDVRSSPSGGVSSSVSALMGS